MISFHLLIFTLFTLPPHIIAIGKPTSATESGLNPELILNTTSGVVQGFLEVITTDIAPSANVELKKFLGIRYAQDTSGSNRWLPPKALTPILGSGEVFNASSYGPACLQGRADGGNGTSTQSEDCLRINIIAPSNARNLPVYLYSHGGGFDSGASSDPKIDGSYMAATGIVFASYNYRLSLFGFPHANEIAQEGKTQNLGLLDTRAAVVWLRENVEKFGGDPNKITLGGESVGAEMTNFYLSAYYQEPLIRGAIMQSADTAQPMWPLNSQISVIASNLGCPAGPGLLDCLRQKSGEELQKTLLATGVQFQPVTDNVTIWKDYVAQTRMGHTTRVPLLIGTNKDEGTLIVEGEQTAYLSDIVQYSKSNNLNFPFANLSTLQELYPVPSQEYPSAYNASAAMWRDAHMLCLAHNLAVERSRSTRIGKTTKAPLPVWRYRFDLVASNLNSRGIRIGTFHGSDIRFVMGQWRTIVLSPPFVPATPKEIAVSGVMLKAWTNFVKDPSRGPQTPGWQKFDPNDRKSLAILGNSVVGAEAGDHFMVDKVCSYWNEILPKYPQTFPKCGSWTC